MKLELGAVPSYLRGKNADLVTLGRKSQYNQ
jgi:hypothetical protein